MRKILAATALAGAMLAAPAVANAATFTQSDFAGPGNFGTITAMDLGGGVEQFSLNMAPNVLLQTGSHFLFTFSLTGGGFIDPNSIAFGGTASNVSVLPHTDPASYMNAPFKFFSDGISADCGSGGSGGGCGSTLIFNVDNFVGLAAATQLYNGLSIFAAADILLGNCSGGGPTGGGCTGVVGVTTNPSERDISPVPIPGAVWLFGTGVVGMMTLMRRRKQRQLPMLSA